MNYALVTRGALVSAMVAVLAGCATVDSAGDIDRSRQIVAGRSGQSLDWHWPASPDAAEVWDGTSPLTVSQAVQLALNHNPAVQADLARISAARADLVQAGLLPNPVLSASFGLGNVGGASTISGSLMQPLSALWLRPGRQRAAEADLQQTVLRVSDRSLSLAAEVEKHHRLVLHEQAMVSLLAEQRELLRQAQQAAERAFEAGIGSRLDVNRMAAEQLQTVVAERAAHGRLAQQKLRLLELMGRAEAGADWSASQPSDALTDLPDEQALVAVARAQRLDILSAQWAARAQGERLGLTRLESITMLEAGPVAETERSRGEAALTTTGAGAALTLPVFDQGQARIYRARAELREALTEVRRTEQAAIRQVRQAYQALLAAEERQHTYQRDLLPLAERNLVDTRASFEAGDSDLVAVLLAERDWAEARKQSLQLILERDLSLADLSYAIGGRTLLDTGQQAP